MQLTTTVSEAENHSVRVVQRGLASDDFTAAAIGLMLLALIIAPAWWVAANYGILYAILAAFCSFGLISSALLVCAVVAGKRSEY